MSCGLPVLQDDASRSHTLPSVRVELLRTGAGSALKRWRPLRLGSGVPRSPAIHHTPASGARGLAVKGYFIGYYYADATPEIADFSTSDSYADNGELAHWDSRAVKSFFDDAARFVPELQSVVGGILSAPVRVPPRPEWMAALRERWEALGAEYVAPLPEGDEQ